MPDHIAVVLASVALGLLWLIVVVV